MNIRKFVSIESENFLIEEIDNRLYFSNEAKKEMQPARMAIEMRDSLLHLNISKLNELIDALQYFKQEIESK